MAKVKDIIAGLDVIKEVEGDDGQLGGAEHDVIFGPIDSKLNDEQRDRLKSAGWHNSKEYDCWCRFV